MKLVCGVKCQGNGYSGRKEGRTGRRHDDFSVLKRFYFYFYKITHLPVHLSFVHVSVCTFYKVFFFFNSYFPKSRSITIFSLKSQLITLIQNYFFSEFPMDLIFLSQGI